MKKTNKLLALLLVVTLIFGVNAYASFPVKNEAKKEQTSKQISTKEFHAAQADVLVAKQKLAKENSSLSAPAVDNEMIILLLLWFFLGGLAAHRWYAKKPIGWNILFILTAGGCGIWAIIDLIKIIQGDFN
jgi:hypothetical protein